MSRGDFQIYANLCKVDFSFISMISKGGWATNSFNANPHTDTRLCKKMIHP